MKSKSVGQKDVEIRQAPIELSQFLKLAQVVMSGGEAKTLVQSGEISVNGVVETRRSRQLQVDDVVVAPEHGEFKVTMQPKRQARRSDGAS